MPQVQIRENKVCVGSKKHSLLSGEVHYWRLNPHYWKPILKKVKGLGLEVISTYVPWHYHEPNRGQFDFSGTTDPARNLKGFLDLVRREGFQVVIRPGPYIYSEWHNDGVPDYAAKYHRLHPKFLSYAKTYLKKVLKVLKPFFASEKNGNVILLQADNEIDPWPDKYGHQYGISGKPGLFQKFIQDLYDGNLRDLNASWKTNYKSFKEVGSFTATMLSGERGLALKGDQELKRNLDYLKFKHDYAAKVAQWNRKTFRELGVDIPIYLNVYPFFYAHDWVAMQKECDLVGVDLYPHNELAEDEFEHRKFMDKVRYLRHISKLPFIAEFECGVWHQHIQASGVFTPNHYRLLALSALLAGCVGWNWYMLVNRDNWYLSPINECGQVREELYPVFKDLTSTFKKMDPPSLKKEVSIGATFQPLQYAARTIPYDSPSLVALYESDIDYEMVDLRLGPCPYPVLFYSGNQWLDTNSLRKLRRYVESGGNLVAFQDYPRRDDFFKPSPIVGFEDPKNILFEFKKPFSVQLAKNRSKSEICSTVYEFSGRGAGGIQGNFGKSEKLTVGYIKKVGKGRLLHFGFKPNREFMWELLDYLKVKFDSYSTTDSIKTGLFRKGKTFFLVVVNNGQESKTSSIYLPLLDKIRSRWQVTDLSGKRRGVYEKGRPLVVEVPRKDGLVLQIVP